MRTLPFIAVSKAYEKLHCHERGQNALMQVKEPSLTNEHSDLGLTKMSDGVTAITTRDFGHPLKSPVGYRRRATWRRGEFGLVSDEGEQ
jgi:hypothetical protein